MLLLSVWLLLGEFKWAELDLSSGNVLSWLWQQKDELTVIIGAWWGAWAYWSVKQREKIEEAQSDARIVSNTLNVSVNMMTRKPYTLKFRTLKEVPPGKVFSDKQHLKRIEALAEDNQRNKHHFLHFNKDKPCDQEIGKIMCNYLSALCRTGHMAQAMDQPVCEELFVFGITNEQFGEGVSFKLRLMLIRESTLKDIFNNPDQAPVFEKATHEYRWETLKDMSKMYFDKQHPEHSWMRFNQVKMVLPNPNDVSTPIIPPNEVSTPIIPHAQTEDWDSTTPSGKN